MTTFSPACNPLARLRNETGKRRQRCLAGMLQNGSRQGVLGALLKHRRQPQDFLASNLVRSIDQHDIRHVRRPASQGTGLVHRQHADMLGTFQRFGILHQNAHLRALPGAHHDRRWCRQPERTGAGNHQHGDGIDQRLGQIARMKPPAGEGEQRDHTDRGNKYRRYAIGQPLHRGFRALSFGHQTNDAGQQRMLANTSGATAQLPELILGRSKDTLAHRLGNRHAFAGEHGFVDTAGAINDYAVDRHAFARPDNEDVVRHQGVGGHFEQPAIAFDTGRSRLQAYQRFDGGAGAGLGPRLQQLTHQHQRNDGRRSLEIDMTMFQPEQRDEGRETPRHAGAERHQHIHVGTAPAATAQGFPGTIVETPANPELHGSRQQKLQPAGNGIRVGAMRRHITAAEHPEHLQQQGQGQCRSDPETPQFSLIDHQLARLLLLARTVVGNASTKPGFLDGGDQLTGRHQAGHETHSCTFGSQIDAGLDAIQTIQHFLDAGRTGGTGHAFDRQLDGLRRHAETDAFDCGKHCGRRGLAARDLHPRALGSKIDAGVDTGQTIEHFLDARRASGTRHASQWQVEAGSIAFVHFTSSIGQCARCRTRCETEPRTTSATALRPLLPMMIQSHPSSAATRTTTSAASPT